MKRKDRRIMRRIKNHGKYWTPLKITLLGGCVIMFIFALWLDHYQGL